MKTIVFDGKEHQFPDDATDEEIAALLESVAPVSAPPSAAPTGGFLERLSNRYGREVEGGLQWAAEGIEKMTHPNNTMGGRAIGAGQTLLGGLQYAASPVTAAIGAVAGDPVRLAMDQAGAPQWATEMAGNTAEFGAGMIGGQPAVMAAKTAAREATPLLSAMSRGPARTASETLAAAKDAYKRAEMTGAVVKPEAFKTFVDDVEATLRREGYTPGVHKQVAPVLKEMRTAAKANTQKNFEDIEKLRRVANQSIMSSTDDANMAMAYKVRNAIDDFTGNVQPQQMLAGDAKEAAAAWREGRELYRKQAQMGEIDDILETAARQEDPDKYIRQQFTRINKDSDQLKQFTEEQRKLIKDIANRGTLESAISYFAPGSGRNLTQLGKSALGGIAGFSVAGPAGAAAIPMLAAVGEKAAKMRRVGKVTDLSESISRGKVPDYLERVSKDRAILKGMGR